jgi:predicted nucleic acid-binding protein
MEIIIDASAILAVLLNEPEKHAVIMATEGCVLTAPGCLEYEIGNAVSALYKRKLLAIPEGILVWHEFAKIPVRLVTPPFPSALTLAGTELIYAYDAYYIACAEQLRIPLLTLDSAMMSSALSRGVECLEVM